MVFTDKKVKGLYIKRRFDGFLFVSIAIIAIFVLFFVFVIVILNNIIIIIVVVVNDIIIVRQKYLRKSAVDMALW